MAHTTLNARVTDGLKGTKRNLRSMKKNATNLIVIPSTVLEQFAKKKLSIVSSRVFIKYCVFSLKFGESRERTES